MVNLVRDVLIYAASGLHFWTGPKQKKQKIDKKKLCKWCRKCIWMALSANIHAHSWNVYSASTWIFYQDFFLNVFVAVIVRWTSFRFSVRLSVASACTAGRGLVYLSCIVCFSLYDRIWYIESRSWTAKPPYFRYVVCGPCVELWMCTTQTANTSMNTAIPWIHRNIYCDAIIHCAMHTFLFPIFSPLYCCIFYLFCRIFSRFFFQTCWRYIDSLFSFLLWE